MPYLKAKDAAAFYHVDDSTLRRWAREGSIKTEKTKGGRYKYWTDECYSYKTIESGKKEEEIIGEIREGYYIYARVSSKKQKGNLENQIKYMQEKYPGYTVIKDIGSGLNYERAGFKSLLVRLFNGEVKKVLVAHPDRFCRFGFTFYQWLFQHFGGILESDNKPETYEQEFTRDLIEVITVFSAKYHGKRKYSRKEDQDISDSESETIIQ
jgi:predicted site-specific integrase-resolvase